MNLSEALAWGMTYLKENQIAEPRLETELLLAHSLGIPRTKLLTIEADVPASFQALIARRAKHEPTAYIIGVQPFFGLDFFVDRSVLIPRPETELLVENAITLIRHSSFVIRNLTIADLGTGSGCIAISLAKNLPNINVIGIDSSPEALAIAKKNADHHQVADRCHFLLGNMVEPLKEKIDLVVANPPYIPSAEIKTLQPEVRDWEPVAALDGGIDGLDHIRQIIKAKHPRLIMEFGFGQAEIIRSLAEKTYKKVEIKKDYAGIDRILIAQT